MSEIRDKESNLDLHVQSVVSCRLDDPGTRLSVHPPLWEIDAAGGLHPNGSSSYGSSGRSRTMFSMPLAYPSTLDRRPPVAHFAWSPSYVEELWSPSLNAVSEKLHAKADANSKRAFQRTTPRVFLSQAGPRFDLELVQAEHHLWLRR